MKILFCHNYYQQAGGEDVVVTNEMAMLKSHGHDVQLYSVSNRQIDTFWKKVKVSLRLTHSNLHKKSLKRHIEKFSPDIVHVHNFFPLLTPSIFNACNQLGIPVVHTLHNYRLLCPSATLFINGKNNTESLTKNAYAMVKHKAYKNSYLGTFLLARAIEKYKKSQLWHNRVDQFIAPSSALKNIYVNAGFNKDKITVKPNFKPSSSQYNVISSTNNKLHTVKRNNALKQYAIFLGRLEEEKGIKQLLTVWRSDDIELRVYGSGTLKHLFKNSNENAQINIKYMGEVNRQDAMQALAAAQYLVMPTLWQEPFGLVTIEALSLGIPVIASNIGALPEIITHNQNGLLFDPLSHNDLRNQIDVMKCDIKRDMMSHAALESFQNKFCDDSNYPQLLNIYQNAILGIKAC